MRDNRIRISGGFCVFLAFMLLMLPLKWLVAAVLSAIFHEFCHMFAIRLCAGQWPTMRLYSRAAHISLPPMSRGREAICALAGPAGGLMLLLVARWMPRLALCGAMQSLFNLFPIFPLDGGRALKSGLLLIFTPPQTAIYCRVAEIVCKILLCIMAIYGSFWLKLGAFPLLVAAYLLLRIK